MIKLRTLFVVLAVAFATLSLGVPVRAEQPADANKEYLDKFFQAIGSDLSAKRDSAMSALIQMNEDEKKVFRSLKKQYDKELKSIFDARFEMLSDFGDIHEKLNADNAAEIADRAFSLEDRRTALHRKYFKLMSKQVSPVVAVQYLQLQSQFEIMADMKIASQVPLAMN